MKTHDPQLTPSQHLLEIVVIAGTYIECAKLVNFNQTTMNTQEARDFETAMKAVKYHILRKSDPNMCQYVLRIIENHGPVSAAFQEFVLKLAPFFCNPNTITKQQ